MLWIELERPGRTAWNRVKDYRIRALCLGQTPKIYGRHWERAIRWFDDHCAYCGVWAGELTETLTCDHFIPVASGGQAADPANIVPCCWDCNNEKHDQDAATWLRHKFGCAWGNAMLSEIYDYFESYQQ